MAYQWDFAWVLSNWSSLASGVATTGLLTLATIVLGFLLAILWAGLRISGNPVLSGFSRLCVELFRDLPVLVVLVWLYFCLPILVGETATFSPFWIAVVGLALNYSALEADILRSAYLSIPRSELEAARSFGFSRWQLVTYIVLPQAFWRALAPTLGQAVNTLKLTSLASFITVPELFYVSGRLIQETFRPLEFYTALAAAYLVLIFPLSAGVQVLEHRLQVRFAEGVDRDHA